MLVIMKDIVGKILPLKMKIIIKKERINMKKIVSKILPMKIKMIIRGEFLLIRSILNKYPLPFRNEIQNKKKFIIFGTPTHGNLGDQAIAMAERHFLEAHYPDYTVIEIPTEDTFSSIRCVSENLAKDDLIFLHGGGNIGDLYLVEEIVRRKIIKTFRQFPIIQFPQSATFTSNKNAKKELLISKKIYGLKGKKLTIIARENLSYTKFKKIFSRNNILYTPDIVLTLDKRKVENRTDILLCLRNDYEKILSDENQKDLISELKKEYAKVVLSDTIVNYSISQDTRIIELEKKWNQYRKSKVIITDRLHGMIFAVITGTPCIVFDNFNQKIQRTYKDWLYENQNIKFIDVLISFDINIILKLVKEVEGGVVSNFDIDNKYDSLINEIQKYA